MATSSFNKDFKISDPKVILQLLEAMENPTKVKVRKVNLEAENKRGIELLRKRLTEKEILDSLTYYNSHADEFTENN